MIDSIKTFGDSFLFGSDLSDCKDTAGKYGEHSLLTWPALIAKDLDLAYYCSAEAGRGNTAITAEILANAGPTCLNIINWTWIDRFDYNFRNHIWPETIRPGNDNNISKEYYATMHSELDDKLRNLITIHSAISYLKTNNMPFICTYMDHLILDQQYNCPKFIRRLQDQIKNDLNTFPYNQTFLEWSRANNHSESDNWHPLEQAHQEAADIWLPIYKKAINTHIANL